MTTQARPLTPRQDAFVRYYTTPGDGLFNGTAAARLAGYKGSENTHAQTGHQNIRKPYIWSAIRARLKELYSASDLSVDRVLNDIEFTRQCAIRDGHWTAALRASELHGKYLTMWIERIEHVHTIEDVATNDLVDLANRLAERIDGLNFHGSPGGDETGDGSQPGDVGTRTTH